MVMKMKIVGTHDELLLLKLNCQKHGKCEFCIMQDFCEKHDSPLDLFLLEKIQPVIIQKGDGNIAEQSNKDNGG